MSKLEVTYRKVADLIPYARNARTHSPEQVARIAGSIKEFGWTTPILVDGENGIIAGHGRLAAAQKLKMTEVPCIELSGLTDTQRRAYILADNKLALDAGWDEDILKIELDDLKIEGVDLDAIGFSEEQLNDLSGGNNDGRDSDDDRVSEALTIDPISTQGVIWVLGDHRLMCGDSTDREQVLKLCESADVFLSDPPYGINIVRQSTIGSGGPVPTGTGGRGKIINARKYLPVKADASTDTAKAAIEIAREITQNQIIFGGNYFTDVLPPSSCWIVWDKENGTNDFADCELAWASYPKAVRKFSWLWNGLARKGNHTDEGRVRIHPTQKPVGLLAEILTVYTEEGQSVLDLFGGSGSTLIACEKTGRKCFMMEYEPAYIDLIVERWQTYTGKKATTLDGQLFDDLKGVAES